MTSSRSRNLRTTTSSWRSQASCLDIDPELFFPVGTLGPAITQIKQAQRVCRTCPVTMECLNWAMRTGQQFGIWGGLSENERRDMFQTRPASSPNPPVTGTSVTAAPTASVLLIATTEPVVACLVA